MTSGSSKLELELDEVTPRWGGYDDVCFVETLAMTCFVHDPSCEAVASLLYSPTNDRKRRIFLTAFPGNIKQRDSRADEVNYPRYPKRLNLLVMPDLVQTCPSIPNP